jgi:hypothetical protein
MLRGERFEWLGRGFRMEGNGRFSNGGIVSKRFVRSDAGRTGLYFLLSRTYMAPEELMSEIWHDRAQSLLSELVGSAINTAERLEYQLRLKFEGDYYFDVFSPWRLIQNGEMLFGSRDNIVYVKKELANLCGLRVLSASVLSAGETRLFAENDFLLEVIPESVQYEVWTAHVKTGLVVVSIGNVTVFPPGPRAKPAPPPPRVYRVQGAEPAPETTAQLAAELMQGVEGLESVGIGIPPQIVCGPGSRHQRASFDVAELNGVAVALLAEDKGEDSLLNRVQRALNAKGARENYGPAGIFQNGSQILVPELQARFLRHLHVRR